MISAIDDGRQTVQVVQSELTRGALERLASERFGDAGDLPLPVDRGPGFGQQPQRLVVVDADAGVDQELEGLIEDLSQQAEAEDLESRSHAGLRRGTIILAWPGRAGTLRTAALARVNSPAGRSGRPVAGGGHRHDGD